MDNREGMGQGRTERLAGRSVPELHHTCGRSGTELLAVGLEGDKRHFPPTGQYCKDFSRRKLPQASGPVPGASQQALSIRAQRETIDGARMVHGRDRELLLRQAPEIDSFGPAAV